MTYDGGALITTIVTPYSDWPGWLQFLILVPNVVLAGYACWFWLPKSDREWSKLGFVFIYLVIFFSVMIFVFHFR